MKRSFLIVFATLCAISAALPLDAVRAQAAAPAAASSEIPLVVIRFNQRKVYYERQLYNAVSRAVAIKPQVMLELVSFVPEGSSSSQSTTEQIANNNLAGVINTLNGMGVPRERIQVVKEHSAALRFHEVHLYVK